MKFDEFRNEFEKVLQKENRMGFKTTCSSCGQKQVISFKDRELAMLITTFIVGDNTGHRSKQRLIEELARANDSCKIVPSRCYAEDELHGQVSRILSGLLKVCEDFKEFIAIASTVDPRFTTESLTNVTLKLGDLIKLNS